MTSYVPSGRGMSAVVLAVLAGMILPAMTPTRGEPIPPQVWVSGSLFLLMCVAASVMALLRKGPADRIAGGLAGIVTLWMIYAFYTALT